MLDKVLHRSIIRSEMRETMSFKIINSENGSHINEGGWSPEAINRAKNIQFYLYDTRTKRTIPIIGIDAVDVTPNQYQIKFQKNLQTGKITILDNGLKLFKI